MKVVICQKKLRKNITTPNVIYLQYNTSTITLSRKVWLRSKLRSSEFHGLGPEVHLYKVISQLAWRRPRYLCHNYLYYTPISHPHFRRLHFSSRNKRLSADGHIKFTFQAGNLTFLNRSIYCCNTFFFSNNNLLMKTPLNKCIPRNLKILNTLKNGTIWVCFPPWAAEGTNRCGTVFTGGRLHMHTSVTLSNKKKSTYVHW